MIDAILLHAALSYMPRVDKSGWWSQAAGGYESLENDRANTIGVGIQSGNYELRLSHTSAFSQAILYTSDENYNPASANGCNGPCEPTTVAYNRQTNTALTGMGYWHGVGLGVDLARVDWQHRELQALRDDPYTKRFNDNHWFRVHNIDYVLGVRLAYRYGPFEIEYASEVKLLARTNGGVCCPPSKETFSIGVFAPIKFN
jgi:hypothetical protein